MADLEAKKKERSVVRRLFTRTANELEPILIEGRLVDSPDTYSSYRKLLEHTESLIKLDKTIKDLILINFEEEDLERELDSVYEYKGRWMKLDALYKKQVSRIQGNTSGGGGSGNDGLERRNFKLPKLEISQFDGQLKNWLPFWGQFNKIHNDQSIDETDKYMYLLQSMKVDSEVRELVQGFPATAYRVCVEELKSRFAREDLLIQIYIREILALVLLDDKTRDVSKLYDRLSAQLRALETLNVTQDKYAAFLLPMVESALPQETLKIWERNRQPQMNVATELSDLLMFLRKEVESEQRLKLSKNTFNSRTNTSGTLTAECLVANVKLDKQKTNSCVWCDKDTHASVECYKITRMTLDQKKKLLKEKKACPICLRVGHHPKACRASVKCLICMKRHSTAMCPDQKTEEEANVKKEKGESSNTLSSISSKTRKETLLQTVLVDVQTERGTQRVRALLDSGSQRTYIKKDVVEKLNMTPVGKELLTHVLFGGMETQTKEFSVYEFKINAIDNSFNVQIQAISQSNICGDIPKVDSKLINMLGKYDITLTDRNDDIKEISLLIGADYLGYILTGTMIQMENGLVAVKTKVGWTLQGKQVSVNVSQNNLSTVLHCVCDNMLTDHWSLETLGIRDPAETKSRAEIEADTLRDFEENIQKNEENRYVVKLPLKTDIDDLLPNYDISKRRLESLSRKLVHTGKFNDYDSVFKTWKNLGIIEPAEDIPNSGHYLPHRPVIKEQSLTSSIRPVFDASAKDKNGLSLNACLEKGSNMIDLIPNLINNFRTGMIGMTSDIEKAFLMIGLGAKDREYLKFLWYKDDSLKELIAYRHCRVVFGLTCSPFLLAATLHHHLNKITSGPLRSTAELLNRSLYVDNCVVSMDTKEEADNFILKAKEIMKSANFNLRMWVTSHGINEAGKKIISVLGLNWDTVTDELFCNYNNLPPIEDLQNITKRTLLSITQKLYDPIGYTSVTMLIPKLIIQEAWRRGIEWDSKLPEDLLAQFLDWYKHIPYLKECRIPRRLTTDKLKESQVSFHLFTDASKNGYGACVFLRSEKDRTITVQMIAAKSRVMPLEKVSIPRAELIAALIGSRLLASVRESLKLQNCSEYCWTDSSVTLCWIKRQLPLKTFVGNRIKEIRQNTDVKNWFHIPGEDNWADIASRGCDARILLKIRYWEGPTWLRAAPQQWPRSELKVDENLVHLETKQTVMYNHIIHTDNFLNRLQCYFSKYTKIIRMTAWTLRFTHNVRHVNNRRKGEITGNEYDKAEKLIVRLIQTENQELIEKKARNLTKYTDHEGLIRIRTKLLLSDFPEAVQTPYLLPDKDPVVKMLVRHRHEQLQHAGKSQLIADIRTRFWIVGMRRLVRSVIASCTICMRYRCKPTRAPTAPLPLERVTCTAPFSSTGVDLGGPLMLRNGEKCWIVLYTCAVYRAVHLEITRSLSTEAFMQTLRRFIARRGRVSMLISDQGTNFHGTKNLMSELDWNEIQKQSSIRRITWKMNAPTAAWWGGYWERLIRIMKDLLRRILGKASVSYDELLTLVCDCEAVMNGRPLTYINDDNAEYLEPLTPIHFIQSIPNSDVTDLDEIDSKGLNSRLRYIQSLRDQFRQRFKSEYLTFLVQKGKEKKDSLQVGDIVLIETDEKRIKWPLGIIEEMYAGRDGVERTARVKTHSGVRIRPVQRIYKLELSGKDLIDSSSPSSPGEPIVPTKPSIEDVSSNIPANVQQKFSRRGRRVKLPSKFDLYNLH